MNWKKIYSPNTILLQFSIILKTVYGHSYYYCTLDIKFNKKPYFAKVIKLDNT